ncbi:MAG: hypothetical protein R2747_16005 [Pyrinomonadaceae bacterium]
MSLTNSHETLSNFLNSQPEWLLIEPSGKSFALGKHEIETVLREGRLLISFLSDAGFQTWRIAAFERKKREIVIDLTRNFGRDRQKIRLVPRVSAEELGGAVELARLEKANRIAALLAGETPQTRLGRVELNRRSGRFARIIFKQNRIRKAALTDVSETATPEIHLAGAILWLRGLEKRKKNPITEIRILAGKKTSGDLQKLCALLRDEWRRKIKILKILSTAAKEKTADGKKQKSEGSKTQIGLVAVKSLQMENLWRGKPARPKPEGKTKMSQTAREIIRLAPDRIDHIFTRQGETLRFSGLPFARVRKMFGREKCWFGIEREKRLLTHRTSEEFEKLVGDLKNYRRFDSSYRRHAFYRLAPEAWMESILRRNIKRLDANLILSPVYNQFRASGDRIDLLALRRDGRLVIIELKVTADREMIFQAVDYWRKIELQRRKGILAEISLFGDRPIADRPAIIYLVAPTLGYHRDFSLLAETVSEEIEIYRFDLAENWREELKVLRREKR